MGRQICIRISEEMCDRLDREVARMVPSAPGFNRSDLVRLVLAKAMPMLEKREKRSRADG